MPKFVFTKRMSLDFLADNDSLKDSYVEFNQATMGEKQEIEKKLNSYDGNEVEAQKFIMPELEKRFVSGKCLDGEGKLSDIKKEDLKEFPEEFYTNALLTVLGFNDVKKKKILEIMSSQVLPKT